MCVEGMTQQQLYEALSLLAAAVLPGVTGLAAEQSVLRAGKLKQQEQHTAERLRALVAQASALAGLPAGSALPHVTISALQALGPSSLQQQPQALVQTLSCLARST